MQDFTKLNNPDLQAAPATTNEYGGIYDKQKQPKKGFIEARLNKDNFWNLVFAVGMTFGWVIAFTFGRKYPAIGFVLSWSTILGVPFIVRKYSKVIFSAEKTFLNSQGKDISSRIPNNFLWPILVAVGVTALFGNPLGIHGNNGSSLLALLFLFSVSFTFFLSFSSYFILINCPISVLFNLDFWKEKSDFSTSYQPHHKSPFDSSHDDRYSLSRSYLPSNIHHRSR